MTTTKIRRTIDTIWRIESAKVIAGLTRIVRDVGVAEDLAQDALVAALEQWPKTGIPKNPAAWLVAVAKRRAVDRVRRDRRFGEMVLEIGRDLANRPDWYEPDFDSAADGPVEDDLLCLIFMSCHPVLSRDARVALTLRLFGGLTTEEIARAFLVPAPTVAQRIVRAKRKLAEEKVAFATPSKADLPSRLSSVLEVIYLIFNEGYAATVGDDWVRPALCQDALRLGRILAELVPGEPEVHGLVALMEIQASRLGARIGPNGEPVLLLDQDRSRWDRLHIRRGLEALERAEKIGGPPGPYVLQAAIAACHARARVPADTDWKRIVALYEALLEVLPSPIVELNRAVAVSMACGPEAALALVDELAAAHPALGTYHLLPSVRGDLLWKLGRFAEAKVEFERAATLTRNSREQSLLLRRASECGAALRAPSTEKSGTGLGMRPK